MVYLTYARRLGALCVEVPHSPYSTGDTSTYICTLEIQSWKVAMPIDAVVKGRVGQENILRDTEHHLLGFYLVVLHRTLFSFRFYLYVSYK